MTGPDSASSCAFVLVLSTCPDVATAQRLATAIVDEGLASCANVVPELRSVYRWQGRQEHSRESLLLVKAPSARFGAIEARLRELHPYELPEIIGVPIIAGSAAYLAWLEDPAIC